MWLVDMHAQIKGMSAAVEPSKAGSLRGSIVFALLLLYLVFYPTFLLANSAGESQVYLFVSFPAILIFFYLLLSSGSSLLKINAAAISILISFFLLFSTIVSKLDFIDFRLILSHIRYLSYFVVFAVSVNLAFRSRMTIEHLWAVILFISAAIMAFILLQILFPGNVMVATVTNRAASDWLGYRIGGPFVWSYALAFCLIPVFATLFAKSLMQPFSYFRVAFLILISAVIFGGQSKAAYLAYGLIALFVPMLCVLRGSRPGTIISLGFMYLSLLALSSFMLNNLSDFGNIARALQSLADGTFDASTQTRLNQLSLAMVTVDRNLLFGHPEEHIIIENAYGHYLFTFGLVGLMVFIALLSRLAFLVSAELRWLRQYDVGGQYVPLAVGMLMFVLSVFVFSVGSSPIDGHKTSYYFWALLGAFFGVVQRLRASISSE